MKRLLVLCLVAAVAGCDCEENPIPEGHGRVTGTLSVFQGASSTRRSLPVGLAGFVRRHARSLPARSALGPSADWSGLTQHQPARFVDGDVIVRFRERLDAGQALSALKVDGLTVTHGGFASQWLHRVVLRFEDGRAPSAGETRELAALLGHRPGVAFTEVNGLRHALATPSDSLYPTQWHYPKMNLPAAWDVTQGSASTVVAVLDTGVAPHGDLDGRLVPGIDLISDAASAGDGDGRDDDPRDMGGDLPNNDSSWHGTHVAGTIGAVSNNGAGVSGVDWNARLLAVRVLGKSGGTDFDIAAGITWASGGAVPNVRANANPAAVLNLSLGGASEPLQTYQDAINGALARGAVVVVAAGNDKVSASGFTPCNQAGVICVGATRFNGTRASYSNFGPAVHVMGTGGELAEDANGDGYPDGVLSTFREGSEAVYQFQQGTSMASPHVAGVVSLMKARRPALTSAEALDALVRTADTSSRCNEGCGAGLVNAHAAVLAVNNEQPQGPAKLVLSGADVLLTTQVASQRLTFTNVGGQPLTVDARVTTDSAQRLRLAGLPVTLQPGQSAGLTLSADLTGLAEGTTPAQVQVTSNGGTASVNVKLKVGGASGRSAVLAFVKLNADGAWEAAGGGEVKAADGFAYTFDVPAGTYYAVAGIDSNGNGEYFDDGEPAGFFPTIDSPRGVTVVETELLSGVDFVLAPTVNVSDTESRVVGAQCVDNGPCGSGVCVSEWPGGYCTQVCTTTTCPAGARCVDVGIAELVCLDACTSPGGGQSTCRASYLCYDDGTGGGVCLPRCTSNADCGSATCDTASGYCVG